MTYTEAHEILKLYKYFLFIPGFSIVISSIWPYLLQVRIKNNLKSKIVD